MLRIAVGQRSRWCKVKHSSCIHCNSMCCCWNENRHNSGLACLVLLQITWGNRLCAAACQFPDHWARASINRGVSDEAYCINEQRSRYLHVVCRAPSRCWSACAACAHCSASKIRASFGCACPPASFCACSATSSPSSRTWHAPIPCTMDENGYCRYIFPCYNYIVSGLSTPLFMVIPIVFIFSGAFPALLTVCCQLADLRQAMRHCALQLHRVTCLGKLRTEAWQWQVSSQCRLMSLASQQPTSCSR